MTRRRWRIAAAALLVALTAAGCGVPLQTDPQPLPSDVVPRIS